jgi:hypothetical protein
MNVMPMKDMRVVPSEAEDYFPSSKDAPAYPYGLCISLCSDELKKLGINFDELCVDDIVHLHALAAITSKSSSERQGGEPSQRVELQIMFLSTESEDEENASPMKKASEKISKLYRK